MLNCRGSARPRNPSIVALYRLLYRIPWLGLHPRSLTNEVTECSLVESVIGKTKNTTEKRDMALVYFNCGRVRYTE